MKKKIIFQEYPLNKIIICDGHVDHSSFLSELKRQNKGKVYKIDHKYRVFKRIKPKENIRNGRYGGYNTYVECSKGTKNSKPITIGYFN